MNHAHQVLACMDDVNLIGNDIRATERNACKDFGLVVNVEKTKYMEVRSHQGMMTSDHITECRKSCKKVKTFKYLGSLLTNQNSIHRGIKCILKAGNSCYYSVQTLLSSRLLSKNLKIKMFRTYCQLCYVAVKLVPSVKVGTQANI